MFALLALAGDLGCAGGPTLAGLVSDGLRRSAPRRHPRRHHFPATDAALYASGAEAARRLNQIQKILQHPGQLLPGQLVGNMELPVLFCEKVGGIGPADGVRRVLADLVCVFKLRQIDLLPGFGVQTELAGPSGKASLPPPVL